MPVGYFLIDSIGGETKKYIVTDCIRLLYENNIIVEALTFDGSSNNISMAKLLGCSLYYRNLKPCFKHPCCDTEIDLFYDPCHVLKLVRNTFAEKRYIKNFENLGIKYSFIEKLFNLYDKTGSHVAHKIRREHIEFHKKKMNVRLLAAQLLSKSVSTALNFCKISNMPGFADCDATMEFISNFNNLFDIMNCSFSFSCISLLTNNVLKADLNSKQFGLLFQPPIDLI